MQRGLVGEIIGRFEKKGFKLRGLKLYQTPRAVAEEHYKDLKGKPFYPALVDYIVSGPVVGMVGATHATTHACMHPPQRTWLPCICRTRPARSMSLHACMTLQYVSTTTGVGRQGRGGICAQDHWRHQPAGLRARHHPRRLRH